jgi:small subunit ribosomal protein S16
MAVKIRLTRKGKKKQPTYRVVVADARAPRDGRYIEQIGRYDPRQDPSVVEIDNDRALHWLERGAQPSDAVRKLLEISGVLEARRVREGKVHVVDVASQAEAAAEDAAVAEEPTEDAAAASEKAAGEARAKAVSAAEDAGEAAAETEAEAEASDNGESEDQ